MSASDFHRARKWHRKWVQACVGPNAPLPAETRAHYRTMFVRYCERAGMDWLAFHKSFIGAIAPQATL